MNHLKHRVIATVCSITLLSGTFSLPVFATDADSSENVEAVSQTSETVTPTATTDAPSSETVSQDSGTDSQSAEAVSQTSGTDSQSSDSASADTASDAQQTDPNAPPESYNWEIQSDSWASGPKGPQVAAETAILMDVDSGEILYAKGIDEKRYPASTTKIMTAWLAIENSNLSDEITFSTDAVYNIEPGSTHIGIQPGEILTMEQSLYAILLASANEGSNGVAEYVGGGSISAFVDKMNERAVSPGCTNTHFMNPSGLHDDNHYTTARDLATIACSAFQNKIFRKIIGTEYYIEPKTNLTDEERWLNNHNKMLLSGEKHYDGCLGGKTGYTTTAGNTLVTFAERDNLRLVCVVLADTLRFQYSDTASLFDYGFGNFHKEVITENQRETTLHLLPADTASLKIKTPEFLSCVEKGNCVTLPNDVSLDSVTYETRVESDSIFTDCLFNNQVLMTKQVKILPSKSIQKSLKAIQKKAKKKAHSHKSKKKAK